MYPLSFHEKGHYPILEIMPLLSFTHKFNYTIRYAKYPA